MNFRLVVEHLILGPSTISHLRERRPQGLLLDKVTIPGREGLRSQIRPVRVLLRATLGPIRSSTILLQRPERVCEGGRTLKWDSWCRMWRRISLLGNLPRMLLLLLMGWLLLLLHHALSVIKYSRLTPFKSSLSLKPGELLPLYLVSRRSGRRMPWVKILVIRIAVRVNPWSKREERRVERALRLRETKRD